MWLLIHKKCFKSFKSLDASHFLSFMPDHVFTYFPPLARHSSFVLSKLLQLVLLSYWLCCFWRRKLLFIFLLGRVYLISVTAFSSLFLPRRSALVLFLKTSKVIQRATDMFLQCVVLYPILSKGRKQVTGLQLFLPSLCEVNSEPQRNIWEVFCLSWCFFKNKCVLQEMLYVQWSVMRKWRCFLSEEHLLKLQQQVEVVPAQKRVSVPLNLFVFVSVF